MESSRKYIYKYCTVFGVLNQPKHHVVAMFLFLNMIYDYDLFLNICRPIFSLFFLTE